MKFWSLLGKFIMLLFTWFGGLKEVAYHLFFEEIKIGGCTYLFDDLEKPLNFDLSFYLGKWRIISSNTSELLKKRSKWFLINKVPVHISYVSEKEAKDFVSIKFPKGLLSSKKILEFVYNKRPALKKVEMQDYDLCESCLYAFSSDLAYPKLDSFLGTFDKCIHKDTESNYFWNEECKSLIEEIENFLNSEKWYKERGIPYRLGILLYGIQGNGKSRLIDYVVQYYNRSKQTLVFNKEINQVQKTFSFSYTSNCFVIEDYDSLFNGRENISKTLKFDFSSLLEMIDNHTGLVFITTNKLENIDPAIGIPKDGKSTRPGRIHRIIEMKNPEEEVRRKIAKKILYGLPEYVEPLVKEGENDTYAQFTDRCCTLSLSTFWKLGNKEKP